MTTTAYRTWTSLLREPFEMVLYLGHGIKYFTRGTIVLYSFAKVRGIRLMALYERAPYYYVQPA